MELTTLGISVLREDLSSPRIARSMNLPDLNRDVDSISLKNSKVLILELIVPSNTIFTYYKSKAD